MKLLHRGKVRDLYELDEHRLLMVATDRLSAYDVVFPDPIPGKGAVLTALTRWWLRGTETIVPSHWTVADDEVLRGLSVPEWPDLVDRAMVVERCEVFPFECVVRGYAFGTYLKDHPGMAPMTRFETPVFTPSTKAAEGHDEAVSYDGLREALGGTADQLRAHSMALYAFAAEQCLRSGIVLVDTKFEFGQARDGQIKLVDECCTPDSSRFILKEDVDRGVYDSFDKQIVRDYVDAVGWDRTAPAPRLPAEVIDQTIARYRSIQDRITGAAT